MALNEYDYQEYLEEARTRVTEQFKGKIVFDKYLDLLLRGVMQLEGELQDLQQLRSLDTAVGAQLDVIGEIVGQPRGILISELFTYFGFNGSTQGGSYGNLTDPSAGAPWYSIDAPLGGGRAPTDDEYRILIKAKILKNRTMATPEEVIAAYKFLFNVGKVTITESSASVVIGIGRTITAVERGLLFDMANTGSLLPKTVGVKYEYVEFQSGNVFAIAGYPGGNGIGDLNDPSAGGLLSNLVT